MPRFSFIVPAYNCEPYIGECLDSLLGQDFTDFEIIVVNDGSRDGTLQVINSHAARDPRILVIDKPNGGVSSARNAALDAARGEWLVFVDADDVCLSGALTTMDRLIRSDGDVDMVCASSVQFSSGRADEPYLTHTDGVSHRVIENTTHYALWCYALRRSIVEGHGMRFATDLAYSEDRVFLFEYAMYARAIATTSAVTYRYRRTPTQATRCTDGLRIADNELRAARHIYDIYDRLSGTGSCTDSALKALHNHGDFTTRIAILHFYSLPGTRASRREFREMLSRMPRRHFPRHKQLMISLKESIKQPLKRMLGR